MRKGLLIAIIGIASLVGAQEIDPSLIPSEVKLTLTTKEGQHQFHLGELIPTIYSYTSDLPGKYILGEIKIARAPEVQDAGKLPTFSEDSGDIKSFEKMLNSCRGMGFSGEDYGICLDCTADHFLGTVPVNFETPINAYVRFKSAGTYKCVASSAVTTTASRKDKIRPALLVHSPALELTIVDDPSWSHTTALSLEAAYNKMCRGDDVLQNRFEQCSDIAERVTDLDTLDSLAIEVRLFDGKSPGRSNGFWEAIQHTSYPKEAIRLLTKREQDPDVLVSQSELESLVVGSLKIDSPGIFDTTSPGDRKQLKSCGSMFGCSAEASLRRTGMYFPRA